MERMCRERTESKYKIERAYTYVKKLSSILELRVTNRFFPGKKND